MVRIGSGIAAAVLAVGAALAPNAGAAQPSPFVGTWESIDTDGSYQTLRIGGSAQGSLAVSYWDESASLCGGDPARFGGSGRVDGDLLVARVLVVCTPGGNVLGGHIGTETWYLPETDQLTDGFGVVWDRT